MHRLLARRLGGLRRDLAEDVGLGEALGADHQLVGRSRLQRDYAQRQHQSAEPQRRRGAEDPQRIQHRSAPGDGLV